MASGIRSRELKWIIQKCSRSFPCHRRRSAGAGNRAREADACRIDMLLSEGHTDLGVKIEAAKDMIREFKHVYPETMNV